MSQRIDNHLAFVQRCAQGHGSDPAFLAGYRSALFDAAHLCDIARKDIEHAGRPSKLKAEKALIARMLGDAIWDMRDLLPSPVQP